MLYSYLDIAVLFPFSPQFMLFRNISVIPEESVCKGEFGESEYLSLDVFFSLQLQAPQEFRLFIISLKDVENHLSVIEVV